MSGPGEAPRRATSGVARLRAAGRAGAEGALALSGDPKAIAKLVGKALRRVRHSPAARRIAADRRGRGCAGGWSRSPVAPPAERQPASRAPRAPGSGLSRWCGPRTRWRAGCGAPPTERSASAATRWRTRGVEPTGVWWRLWAGSSRATPPAAASTLSVTCGPSCWARHSTAPPPGWRRSPTPITAASTSTRSGTGRSARCSCCPPPSSQPASTATRTGSWTPTTSGTPPPPRPGICASPAAGGPRLRRCSRTTTATSTSTLCWQSWARS